MSLVVLTGAVRSGKSAAAESLAGSRGMPVVVAVAGWGGDEEMARRIAAHRAGRPASWTTIEAGADPAWLTGVPADSVLVLDCLGTLVSNVCHQRIGDAEIASAHDEAAVHAAADVLVAALIAREGDTIVVTNEAGWGVVPAWPSARVFRDALGRANRALIGAADAAYLVIDGRFLDLHDLPAQPSWPIDESDANRD
jgi:adenosyl cobinamide kinase/adenosyl cobinamide phosphate guanylyltransferase